MTNIYELCNEHRTAVSNTTLTKCPACGVLTWFTPFGLEVLEYIKARDTWRRHIDTRVESVAMDFIKMRNQYND